MGISIKTLLCVGCGCFAGGVLRYLTGWFICNKWGITMPSMPWHTLIINFAGCLFMGLFCGLAAGGFITSPHLRLAVTAGLCGGYSTLAAFAYENTQLLKAGAYLTTSAYMLLTLVGSLVFFLLGHATANMLLKA
ncbi:MAG: CrcB family protein [Akkermansia sp.]|nr:CrcB family protein [Bacteroidaceae bacterium]MBR5895260.1 CrcB family protein [Akkermansia sp.]